MQTKAVKAGSKANSCIPPPRADHPKTPPTPPQPPTPPPTPARVVSSYRVNVTKKELELQKATDLKQPELILLL